MAMEEEIKLTAPSVAVLDAVAVDPQVLEAAQGPVKSRDFVATYYDTAEQTLLKHHWAFRLRQEGSGLLRATLKGTGGAMVNGLSRRQEWEARMPGPIHCVGDLPPGELLDQMLAVVPGESPLLPLLVTAFHRRILLLQWGESRGEMALDQGEVRAGEQVHPLCEVELERLAGPMEPLQTLANTLLQRHGLRPSQRSKFGLGLALLGMDVEI